MKRFSRGVLVVVLCVAFSAAGGPLPAQEPPPPEAPASGTPTLAEYQANALGAPGLSRPTVTQPGAPWTAS